MTGIRFSILTEKEIYLLTHWLRQRHVLEFWPAQMTDEQIRQKYLAHTDSKSVFPFLIWLSKTPIGYVQAYAASQVGDGWWPDEKEGTYGIDLFIGDLEYMNKGYGSEIVRAFLKDFSKEYRVQKWIVDVSPRNPRAIRCFEKAGFNFVKEIDTPDGKANLMVML